jgi:hypothetical protein
MSPSRIAIIVASAFCFGFFIWPTPWLYYHPGGAALIRVNRFTGNSEVIRVQAVRTESAQPTSIRVPDPGRGSELFLVVWFFLAIMGLGATVAGCVLLGRKLWRRIKVNT